MKVYSAENNSGGQVLNLDLVDETPAAKVDATAVIADVKQPSFDYSAFKDIDPDINETNFSERVRGTYETKKQYETRIADLEIAATSIYDIDSDENIVRNRTLLTKSNDELVFNKFAYQYEHGDGLSADEAAKMANQKIKDLKEANKYAIEDEARSIRANIQAFNETEINKKRTAVTEARKKTLESSKPDPDLKAKTLAEFDSAKNILGFEIDRTNPKFAEKFEKPVKQYIESGEFDRELADPKKRLEFAVFLKQRELIEKNLKQPKKSPAALPARQIPQGGPNAGNENNQGTGLKKYPRGYQPTKK